MKMMLKHDCEAQLNDLGQCYEIESASIWFYDTNGDCIGDFEINFCPICGKKLRTTEEETKALDELVKQAQDLKLGY